LRIRFWTHRNHGAQSIPGNNGEPVCHLQQSLHSSVLVKVEIELIRTFGGAAIRAAVD